MGKHDRLTETYARYAPGAYRFAYVLTGDQHAAEDLVQEAFTRLWGRFGDWRDSAWFEAYLSRTLLNLARSRAKKEANSKRSEQRTVLTQVQSAIDIADEVTDTVAIWQALMRLPLRQRAALYFRYHDDLSETQTAEAIGCSVSAVKSLVSRALKSIRVYAATLEKSEASNV